MYKLYITYFLTLTLFSGTQCNKCSFFKNLSVIITPKSKVSYFHQHVRHNFNGCFDSEQFDQVISELAVVDQNITELGDHAVRNLYDLKSLSFSGCGIQSLSRRAFENLPKLRDIHIDHGNLSRILGGVFNDLENLEDINLFANEISNIGPWAFSDMSSLKQIILSRNKLRILDSQWFYDSSNLILLDFSYNKIERIDDAFRNNPKLKDIFLDYNEIKFISKRAFHNLLNMEILSLRHNRITELHPNIFADVFKVEHFYLNANYLNFLSEELLKKLSVKILGLEGNPWKCPCLHKIERWMHRTNVTLKNALCRRNDIPRCFYDGNVCSELKNDERTKSFLKTLRNLSPPVDDECANLIDSTPN